MKKRWLRFLAFFLSVFLISDYRRFKKADKKRRFPMKWFEMSPQLKDKTAKTGFDRHYLYHTAWAARKVKEISPEKHTDISSSLYFCSLVSAFVPVEFYDYRPPALELSNLKVERGDLMKLPFGDGEIPSLSCIHTIEHIGLGRYGDPIDPAGDLRAIAELKRALAPGGSLLFVVPIGKPRILFNAHRIYSYEQVVEYFHGLKLREFTLIPETGDEGLIVNATREQADKESYGCGCFWFVKEKV